MTSITPTIPIPHVETSSVSSRLLLSGQLRLDAAHYSKAKPEARRRLDESGYELVPLGDLFTDVFNLPRFKRVYATRPDDGWPYMTPGQLVMFRCYGEERYISKLRAPKEAARHFVEPDWILVTCSGTVGRPILTTEPLTRYFLTHDLIRLIPKPGTRVGYVAAYLGSTIGQTLLKDEYGGTIDHIEPVHVTPIPVPMLPDDVQDNIDAMVKEAYRLRDESNRLLSEAETIIAQALTHDQSSASQIPGALA